MPASSLSSTNYQKTALIRDIFIPNAKKNRVANLLFVQTTVGTKPKKPFAYTFLPL